MVKHIVVWKLKDKALGVAKDENAKQAKQRLEALNGHIPGLVRLEVGIDISDTQNSGDIVLYSEFATKKALEDYQIHPLHKALVPFIVEIVSERKVVDYVI